MATATEQQTRGGVWVRRGVFIALVLVAGVGVWYWVARGPRGREPAAPLVVADTALNFGQVWEDPAFPWELPIENRGGSDLRVAEFDASCGCLAVEPETLEIPSGQTRTVRLTLNLTRRPPREGEESAPAAPRDFAVKLAARVQAPDGAPRRPASWTVGGRVRPALSVEPWGVSFGDGLVRGQPFPARSVSVTAHTSLTDVEVACEPELAAVQLAAVPGEGAHSELTIRPRPDLGPGPVKFTVFLRPRTGQGSLPRVAVPVEGVVVEDIRATPAAVQFGVCAVGQSGRETVVLRSGSGTPFEVERVECEAPAATAEVLKAEPAEKHYRVRQLIKEEGNQLGTVRFHVRPKGGAGYVVPVRIGYLGTAG